MNRRQLLTGLGGVTAAGSLALGTGAFTSASADRHVSVDVADDSTALLSLVPVLHTITGSELVTENDDGALQIDTTAGGADGVNVGATTWVGTPDYESADGWVDADDDGFDQWSGAHRDHGYTPKAAFAMVNHGTETYELSLGYDPAERVASTITFHVYDGWAPTGGGPTVYGQYEFTGADEQVIVSTGHSGDGNFSPGKRVFTSIEIDTHGGSTTEDLSGDLTISARRPD